MNQSIYQILIVEDDPVARKFLKLAVHQSPQCNILDSVGTLQEGIMVLSQQPPDVMLVDLELPDGSGIALIRQARACQPQVECMVVTAHEDQQHLFPALEAGATGYLLKNALPDNIGHSILKLLEGGSPISPAIARSLLTSFSKPSVTNGEKHQLTKRELEVLKLMATGMIRKKIALKLAISLHTINTHIRSIYHKLEVNSNTAAIRKAQQLEVIP